VPDAIQFGLGVALLVVGEGFLPTLPGDRVVADVDDESVPRLA
jgi:hypothetical protein